MKTGLIELHVNGVALENDEPIVILEDRRSERKLRIRVGPFEASAILIELEGLSAPRPLTHDLLAQIFSEGGFILDAVELRGGSPAEPRAILAYHRELRRYEKEVRASDALALALRLDAPVLVDPVFLDGEGSWSPRVLAFETRALRA